MRIYFLILGVIVFSNAYAERPLFSEKEQFLLDKLKTQREHYQKNLLDEANFSIADFYYSQLRLIGKAELASREKQDVLKTLDQYDQEWLFQEVLKRKLKYRPEWFPFKQ